MENDPALEHALLEHLRFAPALFLLLVAAKFAWTFRGRRFRK